VFIGGSVLASLASLLGLLPRETRMLAPVSPTEATALLKSDGLGAEKTTSGLDDR
jgi:hypothetical protein